MPKPRAPSLNGHHRPLKYAPGLYLVTEWMDKGLEFDNVVVDCANSVSEDEEEEKRLRYVHYTRSRQRLYIRYQGTPPEILSKCYADCLHVAKRNKPH